MGSEISRRIDSQRATNGDDARVKREDAFVTVARTIAANLGENGRGWVVAPGEFESPFQP